MPSLEVEPVLANEVFTLADASFIEAMRARGHVFLDFSVLGACAHALRCCRSGPVAQTERRCCAVGRLAEASLPAGDGVVQHRRGGRPAAGGRRGDRRGGDGSSETLT